MKETRLVITRLDADWAPTGAISAIVAFCKWPTASSPVDVKWADLARNWTRTELSKFRTDPNRS